MQEDAGNRFPHWSGATRSAAELLGGKGRVKSAPSSRARSPRPRRFKCDSPSLSPSTHPPHLLITLAHLHTHLHPVLSPHLPHPRRSKIGTANRYPFGSLCLSSPPMKYKRLGATQLACHLSLQHASNL